jgi:uncharacterized protein (DUF58 family)
VTGVKAASQTSTPAWQSPLAYALRWRVAGVVPGAHPGTQSGQSGRFHQTVPFDRAPDPRRIDLRATLRDPFERLHVRQFQQRAAARVEILLDSSDSMRFGLNAGNFTLGRELADAVVRAAYEIQDGIGVSVCAESVVFSYSARRGDPQLIAASLASLQAGGRSARGLIEAAQTMIGRRRLVVLISDFAFAIEEAAELFKALAHHDVIPVHVVQSAMRTLPSWGVFEITELETGRRRMVLLRRRLLDRWRRALAEREAQLMNLSLSHGRPLYQLADRFDAANFSDYLLNQ